MKRIQTIIIICMNYFSYLFKQDDRILAWGRGEGRNYGTSWKQVAVLLQAVHSCRRWGLPVTRHFYISWQQQTSINHQLTILLKSNNQINRNKAISWSTRSFFSIMKNVMCFKRMHLSYLFLFLFLFYHFLRIGYSPFHGTSSIMILSNAHTYMF